MRLLKLALTGLFAASLFGVSAAPAQQPPA